MTGGDPSPEALAAGQLEAYNAHDLERFLSFYADDVRILRLPGGEVLMDGIGAMRARYGALFLREPDLRVALEARIVQGAFVVDHERVLGRTGEGPASAVAIYETGGGRIRRVWFL